jgi:hypothetical protein
MDLGFRGRGIIASKATDEPPICAKKRPLAPKCGPRGLAAYACGYIELGREDTQMKSKPQEMTARRRLITFKEGLRHLRVGRTKAYELINAGKIIAYKQGHQTMIDADSIDAFQAALPRIEPGSLKPTRGRRLA